MADGGTPGPQPVAEGTATDAPTEARAGATRTDARTAADPPTEAAPAGRAPAGAAPGQATPAVRATGLSKRFGSLLAVDAVSFELEAGGIYGLLGPNGSGKTTLIRLLTGMARATSGRAEVLGTPMPSRANLSRIGYMTQSDGIYPALTVGENVRFFAAAYGLASDTAATDALALVDLGDRASSIAGTLSGGQRRRLSLACALVHRPPILFLDEPTVGIDPLLRVQFWRHFRALAAHGTTIIVSSHVMDEADRCDELLFMRAGRIIARGPGEALRREAGTHDLEQAFLHFAGETEAVA